MLGTNSTITAVNTASNAFHQREQRNNTLNITNLLHNHGQTAALAGHHRAESMILAVKHLEEYQYLMDGKDIIQQPQQLYYDKSILAFPSIAALLDPEENSDSLEYLNAASNFEYSVSANNHKRQHSIRKASTFIKNIPPGLAQPPTTTSLSASEGFGANNTERLVRFADGVKQTSTPTVSTPQTQNVANQHSLCLKFLEIPPS